MQQRKSKDLDISGQISAREGPIDPNNIASKCSKTAKALVMGGVPRECIELDREEN
jgi:hypothetical protein